MLAADLGWIGGGGGKVTGIEAAAAPAALGTDALNGPTHGNTPLNISIIQDTN